AKPYAGAAKPHAGGAKPYAGGAKPYAGDRPYMGKRRDEGPVAGGPGGERPFARSAPRRPEHSPAPHARGERGGSSHARPAHAKPAYGKPAHGKPAYARSAHGPGSGPGVSKDGAGTARRAPHHAPKSTIRPTTKR